MALVRRFIEGIGQGIAAPVDTIALPGQTRRPRIKQDFDAIQRAEYADQAFATIRDYFRTSCTELAQIGDELRAKVEEIGSTAFTCSVVNRAKRQGGDAHITVHNRKSRNYGLGHISFVNQPHAQAEISNGSI